MPCRAASVPTPNCSGQEDASDNHGDSCRARRHDTLRPNAMTRCWGGETKFEVDSGCSIESWGCGLGRRLTDWRAAPDSFASRVPTREMSCFGREDPTRSLSVSGALCPAAVRCVFKLRVAQ